MSKDHTQATKMESRSIQSLPSKTRSATPRIDLVWRNPSDKIVYELIKKSGPFTRGELVERTGLPRTTVYDALTRLTIRRLITRFTQPRASRGRRRVFYEASVY
ncbi:MAG: helix-turn-helix domain-containing protein [Candidatus Heimdallarchaeota archaeon]